MLTETARLNSIRERLAAIAPGRWSRVHDGDGCFVEAAGPMGELLPVARFDPGASDDEIGFVVEAPETVGFLLGLVERAISFAHGRTAPSALASAGAGEKSRGRQSASRPSAGPKDFAAECAMKCQEPVFRVFLEERHGLQRPLTDERVVQKVRSLLGVTSRKELNDGGRAAAAWKALRGDFENWKRGSPPVGEADPGRRWRAGRQADAGELRSSGPTAGGEASEQERKAR